VRRIIAAASRTPCARLGSSLTLGRRATAARLCRRLANAVRAARVLALARSPRHGCSALPPPRERRARGSGPRSRSVAAPRLLGSAAASRTPCAQLGSSLTLGRRATAARLCRRLANAVRAARVLAHARSPRHGCSALPPPRERRARGSGPRSRSVAAPRLLGSAAASRTPCARLGSSLTLGRRATAARLSRRRRCPTPRPRQTPTRSHWPGRASRRSRPPRSGPRCTSPGRRTTGRTSDPCP